MSAFFNVLNNAMHSGDNTKADLDPVTRKLKVNQLPVFTPDTYLGVVNDEATMLLLTASQNDYVIRSDRNNNRFILVGTDASDINNWAELTSQDGVLANQIEDSTVAGRTILTSDLAAQKTHLGINNINNTSDADKPISSATQTALNNKENVGVAAGLVSSATTSITTATDAKFARIATTGAYYFGGLSINADPTKFDVGPVKGQIVTTGATPTVAIVDFAGQTGVSATLRTSAAITYVLIDAAGVITQQATRPTPAERAAKIYLGGVFTPTLSTITAVGSEPVQLQGIENRFFSLSEIFGILNDSGNVYSAASGLTIAKSAGVLWRPGINYAADANNPDYITIGSSSPVTFIKVKQTGIIAGSSGTAIDPNNYDNAGVLTAVPNNKFTIQRINLTPTLTGVFYGQTVYNSMAEAEAAVTTETFTVSDDLRRAGCLRAYLIVKQNATDLADPTHAKFITASKFGSVSTAATAVWGSISGTLANQTDLQTALNGKSNTGHTHTATEISDSTAVGRTLLTASTTAVQRTALGVDGFTSIGDTDYNILATDRTVNLTTTLTAPRAWLLPLASSVNAGREIIVNDTVGGVTSVNTIIIGRSGSDTIDGATSEVIAAPYGMRRFISDGVSKWTFDKGVLRAGNNLSDLSSVSTARTNLGIQTNIITVSGTTYSITDADIPSAPGIITHIICTSGSAVTITCNFANTKVGKIEVTQIGAGQITFSGAVYPAGIGLTGKSRAQYSGIELFYYGLSTAPILKGDMA